jgi:cytoskeletal protein CcmA (bactofilin family)
MAQGSSYINFQHIGKKMAFSNTHTLISRTTHIKGDVSFSGELQLEGKVVGNLFSDGEKDARLVIADTGIVEGDIRVPVVIVNGTVTGNVYSSKQLEMAAKGIVKGSVHYHSIQMVKGAQVNGSMVSTQSDPKQVEVNNKKKLAEPVPG